MNVASVVNSVKTEAESVDGVDTTKMNSVYVLDGITNSTKVKEEADDAVVVTPEFQAEPDKIYDQTEPGMCADAAGDVSESTPGISSDICTVPNQEAVPVCRPDKRTTVSLEGLLGHLGKFAVDLQIKHFLDEPEEDAAHGSESAYPGEDSTIQSSSDSHPDGDCQQKEGLNSQGPENTEAQKPMVSGEMSDQRFDCSVCKRKFSDESHLNRHMKGHTDEKRFECPLCGRKFCKKYSVNVHKRVHTGEKPFQCTECKKQFYEKSYLNQHMNVHFGGKPFGCTICGKKFNRNYQLLDHKKIHTGEKPFECNECRKQFTYKRCLKQHMMIHTGEKPFDCSVCGKKFNHKHHLLEHMRCHTGEKPFECNMCGKRFKHKHHLLEHMRCHTGEKPYDCNVCGRKFSYRNCLNHHMMTHMKK